MFSAQDDKIIQHKSFASENMEIESSYSPQDIALCLGRTRDFNPFYEVYSFQSVALIYSDSIFEEPRLPLVDCIIVSVIHSPFL